MVFEKRKNNGPYDFSMKKSFREKINYVNGCEILKTFTEENSVYSRKNVKTRQTLEFKHNITPTVNRFPLKNKKEIYVKIRQTSAYGV